MVRGADTTMVTSFGTYQLTYFRGWTEEFAQGPEDTAVRAMLRSMPAGDALAFPSLARLACRIDRASGQRSVSVEIRLARSPTSPPHNHFLLQARIGCIQMGEPAT